MAQTKKQGILSQLSVPPDRSFGITFTVIFCILSVFPRPAEGPLRYWTLITAAVILLVAFTFPKLLRPFNIVWTLFGFMMGKITNPLLLGILYFLLITPFALMVRLFKRDFFNMKFNPAMESYWQEKKKPNERARAMTSQF
jgi:hypothetical protein